MMAELPMAASSHGADHEDMIPFNMAKDLAEQHAIDLRRMGRAGSPGRTRTIRWSRHDTWRLRTEGWPRRRAVSVHGEKRPLALPTMAAEGGPCPR